MKNRAWKLVFILAVLFSLTAYSLAAGPTTIQNPALHANLQTKIQQPALAEYVALCEVSGQMIGAAPGKVSFISENGVPTQTFTTGISQISGIASYSGNLIIGDSRNNTIYSLDLKNGQSAKLLVLAEVNAQGFVAGSVLQTGKLAGIASDGQNIYAAYSAGYSSSIFKINLATKKVIEHSWAPGNQPQALVFQNNILYILDNRNNQIRRMDSSLKLDSTVIDLPISGAKGLIIRDKEIRVFVPGEKSIHQYNNSLSTVIFKPITAINPDIIKNIDIIIKIPQKIAVLICGSTAETGFDEFWNDTVWMYKTLIAAGYTKEHIYVLYGTGADYASANPNYQYPGKVTDFPATVGWVKRVFDGLKNGDTDAGIVKLKANDSLFVWTFDHGGSSAGMSYLCLMDGSMSAADFSTRLNAASYQKRAILMQQCFSGGFISYLRNNKTFISTACSASQTAHEADTEKEVVGGKTYHHGEYNYYIISALSGKTPVGSVVTASTDSNPLISALEAHNWEAAHNSITVDSPQKDDSGGIGNQFFIK